MNVLMFKKVWQWCEALENLIWTESACQQRNHLERVDRDNGCNFIKKISQSIYNKTMLYSVGVAMKFSTYFGRWHWHHQVLVLFHSRVLSVVANELLQRREPFLTLTHCIVETILYMDLVVEDAELTIEEGEDIIAWFTLAVSNQVSSWFPNCLESNRGNVSIDLSMIPAV